MGLKDTINVIQQISEKYLIDKPYVVGGLPRDIYMGNQIKTTDLDLTTNSPDVMRLGILVADHLNVTFELADDGHLTVFTDDFDLDFSSHFVSEKVTKYLNGEYKGLEEAFSRDFTMNTLHQDLITEEILDPTKKGFQDIKDKIIRTPVPAEITLTDDPRRAYRAINLAVRYNFEIDSEIKDFVIQNEELFGPEKIKDKYITVKINKSLTINPDLTIKLLKEMKLFNKIPLSGDFKNILIKNKLLADYLNTNEINNMPKTAQIAHDWSQYEDQGPAYITLSKWWQNNALKMPGDYDSSYQSWDKWYMQHYRGPWKYHHKGPEETLHIMQQELSSGNIDRFDKPFDSILMPAPLKLEKEKKDEYTSINNGKVLVKPGVNIDNLTPETKSFINIIGEEAEKLGVEIPVITSGWRSIEEQAQIMAKNWSDNGGFRFGHRYLSKLYGEDYGGKVADIFERYGIGREGQERAIQIIQSQPVGSSHILNPGQAIDLRLTSGIKKVLDSVANKGIFDIKITNETRSAAPHYHVSIRGQKIVAKIEYRKQKILKIINY